MFKTTKNEIKTIINKKVHEYNDNWLNYSEDTLKKICDSVYDLYSTEGCYEDVEDCVSNVFAIYEDNEEDEEDE